jgi:hypothetical protein
MLLHFPHQIVAAKPRCPLAPLCLQDSPIRLIAPLMRAAFIRILPCQAKHQSFLGSKPFLAKMGNQDVLLTTPVSLMPTAQVVAPTKPEHQQLAVAIHQMIQDGLGSVP